MLKNKWLYAVVWTIVGLTGLVLQPAAKAVTLGVHLASVHMVKEGDQNNFNPGLYVKLDSGITLGAYHNTLRRTSVYLGWTGEHELGYGSVGVVVGIVNGYKQKVWYDSCNIDGRDAFCRYYSGDSKKDVVPMAVVSYKFPQIGESGISPRISYIPQAGKNGAVLHLSLEKKF